MTLTETLTLLALIATVIHVTFEIAWKVSQNKKDDKNKKD